MALTSQPPYLSEVAYNDVFLSEGRGGRRTVKVSTLGAGKMAPGGADKMGGA
jgi:hypothetical protein